MRVINPMIQRREWWCLGALTGSLGLWALTGAGCSKSSAPAPPQALPVIAAEVLVRDTTNYLEFIGQMRGAQDVEIRARVPGILTDVFFEEGRWVTNGMLLYRIDERPYQASLDQARAVLAQAEASLQKARRDTNRFGPLWQRGAVSRQQYDDALAAELAAAANVQAAVAAVSNAFLQLSYCRIESPIDGIAGKTEVKPGNLVGQGQATLLTTLSSVDPIHLRFSVSEQEYLLWRRKVQQRETPREIFELLLADGTQHEQRGNLVFGDREIDPRTGTFLLEVAFPNPKQVLRPGQFGRVRFPVEVITNAVLVPQRAVQELQAIYSVFVASPESRAEFRKVQLGPQVGRAYVIRDGLKPGEKIVVEGLQRLQNGAPLAVTMTNLAGFMGN